MALKGRQKIQLSCILCFQTLWFRFSTASPCPYINVDFGIHCDMRCQNAVGGFPLWKSHMDVISSISASRFISNTGDEDKNLYKIQLLAYHEIF